jgi:hypothetical protein
MAVRIVFGFVATALWIAVAAFHVQEAWPGLADVKPHQLVDFVARQGAELAFFWLVVGYIWLVTAHFQQGAHLRQTVQLIERVAQRAEKAAVRAEAESEKIQQYQVERVRAAQPLWQIQGRIAHKEQHEINLLNTGAAASSIRARWPEELPLVVALSNSTLVNRGEQLTLKVMFREAPLEKFDVTLEYCDGIRETRRACIAVSDSAVAITHQEA